MENIFNVSLYSLLGIYTVVFVLLLILKKRLLIFNLVSLSLFTVYGVLRLIFLPVKLEGYSTVSDFWFYLSSGILIALLIVALVLPEKPIKNVSSKAVAFAGLAVALAFALSFIKIEFLGGSITLASALPIIVYSYAFGRKRGIIAGIIFGILQFIQKPTVYQPMQAILDYPVAFGLIGLSGVVRNLDIKPIYKFIIGASLGLFLRYISHVISGYFVFYVFAPESFNPFIYSVVYNLNVMIDLAIVILVGIPVFTNKGVSLILDKYKED